MVFPMHHFRYPMRINGDSSRIIDLMHIVYVVFALLHSPGGASSGLALRGSGAGERNTACAPRVASRVAAKPAKGCEAFVRQSARLYAWKQPFPVSPTQRSTVWVSQGITRDHQNRHGGSTEFEPRR